MFIAIRLIYWQKYTKLLDKCTKLIIYQISNIIKKEHNIKEKNNEIYTQNRLHSHPSGDVLEHWWCHNPHSLCCEWNNKGRQHVGGIITLQSMRISCAMEYTIYIYTHLQSLPLNDTYHF